MKKRILFVGEHPLGYTGNCHMMRAILSYVDTKDKFDISVFASVDVEPYKSDIFQPLPFSIIPAYDRGDNWGGDKLLRVIANSQFDILCWVGIDIWRYAPHLKAMRELANRKGFKWVAIVPYDLPLPRDDWSSWIDIVDYPCIYSEFGANLLKERIPKSRYFRPPLDQFDKYVPYDPEKRREIRRQYFGTVRDDQLVFGFVGQNQFRKDPLTAITAFEIVKKAIPDAVLYLHCPLTNGVHNLRQALVESTLHDGDVVTKREDMFYSTERMVDTYNCMDVLINTSYHEGLSWTLLEAMLCGVPIVASDTTAQTELVKDVGVLVTCDRPVRFPALAREGDAWIKTVSCCHDDFASGMLKMGDPAFRRDCREKGLKKGQEWLAGVSNINDLFDEILAEKIEVASPQKTKRQQVLFVQHGNAGDVLMSTQCFKGIKERHPGMPLIYMTQPKFQDIVAGNPLIDQIVDYDKERIREFEVVYDPHGEKILPGGWNNLDTKLADMYPYFCKVKADEMFIKDRFPGKEKIGSLFENDPSDATVYELEDGVKWTGVRIKDFIVIHTTGGMAEYRAYPHMDIALKNLDIPVVQIGGKTDLACNAATIDLRGKLTWRETAWVMKRAKAAVVIDSFPAHLAGALGTPVVVLFGPAPARVTGPIGKGKIICLEPNKLDVCSIMSNCWGNFAPGQRKCTSPCISTISPMAVRKALKGLLEGNP